MNIHIKSIWLILNIILIAKVTHIKPNIDSEYDQHIDKSAWHPEPEYHYRPKPNPLLRDDCDRDIYCTCHERTHWTQEEVDNAKRYIQHRWYYEASVKPLRPPCKSVYLRKNWKCLSQTERAKFVRVFRTLYEKGVVQAYGELHFKWWSNWHKSPEFVPLHTALLLSFEREMWKVDPTVSGMPYWNIATDYAQIWKSCVWKDLGWGGLYRNGYCVRDGTVFRNLTADFSPRCAKRSWRKDGTTCPIYTPEQDTSTIQVYTGISDLLNSLSSIHLNIHLCIGGWYGDMSVNYAPNDVTFWMIHSFAISSGHKAQMQAPIGAIGLTPDVAYNAPGNRVIDPVTGEWKQANIFDKITYFNRTAVEYFQMGYGDLCYVYDNWIDPINRIMRNEPPELPLALRQLLAQAPKELIAKYFPLFALGVFDFTTNTFENLDTNCNPACKPQPFFQRWNDTENGRRLNMQYRHDLEFDMLNTLNEKQQFFWDLNQELNAAGYCNPVVNT